VQIPVDGDFFQGGGNQFNVNAKGSQLSLDVRAPELPGSPRFYYQNDFFGSGGADLNFRVRRGSRRGSAHNRLPDPSLETQARRRVLQKLSSPSGAV
jgi:hypothetical protein